MKVLAIIILVAALVSISIQAVAEDRRWKLDIPKAELPKIKPPRLLTIPSWKEELAKTPGFIGEKGSWSVERETPATKEGDRLARERIYKVYN